MKAIVCEMCGSQDLVKQEGLYVCQNCGTKYSVEEAKKLMVEGVVKIDYSEQLKNNYLLARRAREQNNFENAAKYYSLVLADEPTSWEASFYSVFYKANTCIMRDLVTEIGNVGFCIPNVMELIKTTTVGDEQNKAYRDVATELMTYSLMICQMVARKGMQGEYIPEPVNRIEELMTEMLFLLGNCLEENFHDSDLAIKCYEMTVYMIENDGHLLTSRGSKLDGLRNRVKNASQDAMGRKKRYYWESHPEEKKQLESEQEDLELEKESLNKKIQEIPEYQIVVQIEKEISEKEAQIKALGLFAMKEKKKLKEEQSVLNQKLSEAKRKERTACSEMNERIRIIDGRLQEIASKLS